MVWWVAAVLALLIGQGLLRRWFRGSAAGTRLWTSRFQADRYGLSDLMARLGLTAADVERFTAPRYRQVQIPKRGGGVRLLEIPDDQTLQMQRKILRRLLAGLKCHRSVTGFERGRSIVDAASPHVGKRVVIRIDIRRFFESTTAERVSEWLRQLGWDADATAFLVTMLTHNGHLPQGAATSPRLSNLVNARMDSGLAKLARRFKGDYTRYADDITLSFNLRSGRRVRGIIQVVRRILKRAGYEMHGRKTRVLRRHQRQNVLGLTVNDKVALPRQLRRRLRAVRHHLRTGREATLTPAQLQGWTAFEQMVEARSE